MGLIDTWEKDSFVPLDYVSQTERLLIRWNCSTWVIFSDSLTTYRGTWVIFSDKLTLCLTFFTLSDDTSKHERNDWQLLLWLVFPFIGVVSFYGWSFLFWNFLEFSRNWRIKYENTCYKSFAIIFFALLQSSWWNCYVNFEVILLNYYYWNAFAQSKQKSYFWNLWCANYKA